MLRFLALALFVVSCNESFNAGRNKHDGLPVDGRNPVILLNDSAGENWMGEYAMLLANSGGPELVGIIVTTGGVNLDVNENRRGWSRMVNAARAGGLRNIPDPTMSPSDKLLKPASGNILETDISENYSNGADLILKESSRRSLPYRPLVVVAASRLTDLAIAYIRDPGVVDRVVVVASVGRLTSSGADMYKPNGEMDTWASSIVASSFRYVQVSARYSSQLDVPAERLQDLIRNNSFSNSIWYKQPEIWEIPDAADQVAIAAVGIPGFVTEFKTVAPDITADISSAGPPLQFAENTRALLVTKISSEVAINRFWEMLQDQTILHPGGDASTDAK